jgi:hypothetical protein
LTVYPRSYIRRWLGVTGQRKLHQHHDARQRVKASRPHSVAIAGTPVQLQAGVDALCPTPTLEAGRDSF